MDLRMKAGSASLNDSTDRKVPVSNQLYENDSAYAFAASDENNGSTSYRRPVKNDESLSRLQSQLAKGSARLCPVCGGVMKKRTRRVLSGLYSLALMISGVLLMVFYGWATHFYQAPWLLKFALPAIYYIGSICIGVGFLFFFVRENVWRCMDCHEISKR